MPNTNCLYGIRCPKCGSEEPFLIAISTFTEMWDEGGGTVDGDIEWYPDSYIRCRSCSHDGTVKDFTIPDESR